MFNSNSSSFLQPIFYDKTGTRDDQAYSIYFQILKFLQIIHI